MGYDDRGVDWFICRVSGQVAGYCLPCIVGFNNILTPFLFVVVALGVGTFFGFVPLQVQSNPSNPLLFCTCLEIFLPLVTVLVCGLC